MSTLATAIVMRLSSKIVLKSTCTAVVLFATRDMWSTTELVSFLRARSPATVLTSLATRRHQQPLNVLNVPPALCLLLLSLAKLKLSPKP